MSEKKLSHVNESGRAHMVNIGTKEVVRRRAEAIGTIFIQKETVAIIEENRNKKGDVLGTANIAGICGAKKCADLIPLCHPLYLESVELSFEIKETSVEIRAIACAEGKTGVEMEALTAVSVAALTIYDMCKAVDKHMRIGDIYLVSKIKEPIRCKEESDETKK